MPTRWLCKPRGLSELRSTTMSLLGLSILIASISFLCYKNPPFSWTRFLRSRGTPQNTITKEKNASTRSQGHDGTDEQAPGEKEPAAKEEIDRKAMPPPSVVLKKPLPKPSPPAISTPPRAPPPPQFDFSPPSIPLFPSTNSAQRASGGRYGQLHPLTAQLQPDFPQLSTSYASSLRAPPSSNSSSSLAPPPTHNSIPTKPRQKVLLSPGHSPLDWARLTSSPNANLRGLPPSTPYLRIPPSMMRKNNGRKGSDVWMALGGKVYNITPYLLYHPGGEPEIMKAAGRDGTKLFGEVHPWVNFEGMLESCLVGVTVSEEDAGKVQESALDQMD